MSNSEKLEGLIFTAEIDGKVQHYYTRVPLELVRLHGLVSPVVVGVVDQLKDNESFSELLFRSFRANREFHATINSFVEKAVPNSPSFVTDVQAQGDGWMYVIDQRTPAPEQDVPMEDIIGGFEIRNGVNGFAITQLFGEQWRVIEASICVQWSQNGGSFSFQRSACRSSVAW